MQRTFALIVILFIITAGLVFYALQSQPAQKPITPPNRVTVQPTPSADTTLLLSPDFITLSATGSGSVEVAVDSGYDTISAVQLEIGYDPKMLTNVTVSQGTYFTNAIVLLNQNDTRNGRVSYALGITPSAQPLQGRGTVALISFKKAPTASGTATLLTLMDKSMVTMPGIQGSVLKQTRGATVLIPTAITPKRPDPTTQ